MNLPLPIEPIQSSTKDPRKLDTNGSDPGINSLLALFQSPALFPGIHIETSTPHLSTSPPAQVAQPSPKGPFSPIQFIRNSAKLRPKEPKYNRSQTHHPDSQSVLRTRTRQGYKL